MCLCSAANRVRRSSCRLRSGRRRRLPAVQYQWGTERGTGKARSCPRQQDGPSFRSVNLLTGPLRTHSFGLPDAGRDARRPFRDRPIHQRIGSTPLLRTVALDDTTRQSGTGHPCTAPNSSEAPGTQRRTSGSRPGPRRHLQELPACVELPGRAAKARPGGLPARAKWDVERFHGPPPARGATPLRG